MRYGPVKTYLTFRPSDLAMKYTETLYVYSINDSCYDKYKMYCT